ncbi:DUF4150 domain-containing protein [Paracoccus sp. MC1862]|uniref:DUF4150 domain-containing protein n=1 Tax=Paracoccus sp. MC1862 TaxID=2760307 RepID=UPI001602114D|nr:DUF4150 domain-containing protein [Paracoccus sp. MC1862]MBB1499059.1 DUF4150 domain-containing protein [Paracoccus sp. MC1862]QQO46060.1 DUF4150 domain-containing protein [Paracoccus sp. MC1862]
MSGVFANGLEISGKAVNAKTIAAFPDTCFTPPENPATPPGVPVPYPSFGMASDTENGSGTVFIGGKTVNIKNKSDEAKTSGTEAGCAAKKGIITSKNTGKKYFHAWSNDVKFDGEPVIRFSDLATHNHASDPGQTPPFPEICAVNPAFADCVTLLNKLDMQLHEHGKKTCTHPDQSEHPLENQMMQKSRGGINYAAFPGYHKDKAPCICMRSYNLNPDGSPKSGAGSMKGAPHPMKTKANRDLLKKTAKPTVRESLDVTKQAYGDHHDKLQPPNASKDEKKAALECIEVVIVAYLQSVAKPKQNADGTTSQPSTQEILNTPLRS